MRRTALFLLTVLLLTSCVPAQVATPAPSATPMPTATPAPTLTPTATPPPTPTPTPIPTLPPQQVGGLQGVPDPRVTNPELFDLTRSDAPIPQFVKAMEMAGIGVPAEEVAANLQYQPITGVDGKQYVIGSYYLDPNPQQQNESLEGPIPLIIAEQGENGGRGWEKLALKTMIPIRIGTLITGRQLNDSRAREIYKNEFNSAVIAYQFNWEQIEPLQNSFNFQQADRLVQFAKTNDMETIPQHLVWYQMMPKWLSESNFSRNDYIQIIKNHVRRIMEHYKSDVKTWTVVNEARPPYPNADFWIRKVGRDYIDIAFQTAREVDPSAKLLYSDFGNEIPDSVETAITREIVERLKSKGLIDGLSMHMRINAAKPPRKETLIEMMRIYGVPIYITELTVDLTNVQGTTEERQAKQAEVYKTIMEACLESNVCVTFDMFGIGDNANFLEIDRKQPNADPTLYTDDLYPKPAYYALLQAIFEYNTKLSR